MTFKKTLLSPYHSEFKAASHRFNPLVECRDGCPYLINGISMGLILAQNAGSDIGGEINMIRSMQQSRDNNSSRQLGACALRASAWELPVEHSCQTQQYGSISSLKNKKGSLLGNCRAQSRGVMLHAPALARADHSVACGNHRSKPFWID